ncbi:MAG: ATP-binding protein [Treponema sp.]|nr:ATP-binding protein [Treponema sp.]
MRKFIIFSAILFFIILVGGGILFIFSMQQIIGANNDGELTNMLEIERLRLGMSVNSEISIALKMANSPLIRRYFANPGDSELRKLAFEEIDAYRQAFTAKTVFWVNDLDKIFYSDEYISYIVDPVSPENYWYHMTLYQTEVYNFNINYNPDLNVTNLWINAPVFDENRKPLGMVGTGIDLSTFLASVYKDSDGRVTIYFFNAMGEITGAENVEYVAEKKNIDDQLADTDVSILNLAKNILPDETLIFNSSMGKIAMAAIPLLEWYSVIILPNRLSDFNNTMTSLFLVMLLVMAFVFIIFNMFISGLIKPLRKSMNDAETANRAKSVFIANVSHEIRTPMNSIMGFSELALDDEVSPRTKDYLDKIKLNTEWLLQIINNVLDISKIESGKIELEKIPFDLQDLFTSCRILVMPNAVEKGIELHFYAEPCLGKIPMGDPTRLRQVFINLLTNAIKFTNIGTVKVYAKIKAKTDKFVTIYFEISDSGIGMTNEQIVKIFDPFTQAETSTTRQYGGTGLGLSITKNILDLMGGKLFVESSPGVGSKFSFELTFETMDESENYTPRNIMTLNDVEKPAFEGEILLCEDNPMNQQVISEHLARVGIKTIVAWNGKIGFDMVRGRMLSGEKQFDLVFMDMHMPVMDGLDASKKIIGLNAKVPIIAMTSNVMFDERQIYKNSGLQDCIGKPFTSQELWQCLLKFLKPIKTAGVSQKAGSLSDADFLVESDLVFKKSLESYFVNNNRNKFEEITNALDTGDVKLAHRLVHTLRSNAGQIEKNNLQSAADAVERQLMNGVNLVSKEQLNALETEFNAVLRELAPLINEDK